MVIDTVMSMSEFESFGLDEKAANAVERTNKQNRFKSSGPIQAMTAAWANANVWRVSTLATIIVVALLFSWIRGPIEQFRISDPVGNGYVEPRDFDGIINKLEKSVVTVFCDVSKKQGSQGTAFAIELEGYTDKGKTALITNHHVIEECIDQGALTIQNNDGKIFVVVLENYDPENDLALLRADVEMSYWPTIPQVLVFGSCPMDLPMASKDRFLSETFST